MKHPNLAIIAYVDYGKKTWVDELLDQRETLKNNLQLMATGGCILGGVTSIVSSSRGAKSMKHPNLAIIAYVDYGKKTWVDELLDQRETLSNRGPAGVRDMDSDPFKDGSNAGKPVRQVEVNHIWK